VKGSRDLLFQFGAFHISEMVEGRNFKFGTNVDHERH